MSGSTFRAIELDILKIAAVALPLGHFLPILLPQSAPLLLKQLPYNYVAGILLVSTAFLVHKLFIYPTFQSPLRHLPVAPDRDRGQLLFESPRGATALRWMRQNPDAQLIRMKSSAASMVLCSGADAARDILNTHVYDFEKPWGLREFLARAIGYGLIVVEGSEHRKQRKILNPSFNIRKIRELYPFMWGKTQLFIHEFAKDVKKHAVGSDGWGKVEIGEWASRLTLDIIGPTAMGKDFESLKNESHPVAEAFLELLRPTWDRLLFFGLHFVFPVYLVKLLPLANNKMLDSIGGFLRQTCREIIADKKQHADEALQDYDILSSILRSGELTDDELMDQMLTFLAAGHETTASALTWAAYLCARYPAVQRQLRAEIHAKIPSSSDPITYTQLDSMPYLNGVCEETQRLYPTVPLTLREATKPTTVAGYAIPKGTRFALVPYAINRHPAFWPRADDMLPERWIDTAPDGTQRPNKHGGTSTNFSELTFLHGQRACIGRDFAKAELRCAVAGLIGKFEVELCSQEEPKVVGVITMKPDGGMFLRFREIEAW